MAIDAAAIEEVAYNAYLAYCSANNLTPEYVSYAAVPAALKTERQGIIDDIIADDTLTAQELHQTLIGTRVAADWEYGLTYDATAKTDPTLVDYNAMSVQERTRWKILVAVAAEMAQYEGFDAPA